MANFEWQPEPYYRSVAMLVACTMSCRTWIRKFVYLDMKNHSGVSLYKLKFVLSKSFLSQCIKVLYKPVAWSFLKGSTIAKYLSADRAVRVNTDTPILTSLAASDTLQTVSPHGQDSTVYTIDVNGTQVMMTRRSARAKERIYLEIIGKKIK